LRRERGASSPAGASSPEALRARRDDRSATERSTGGTLSTPTPLTRATTAPDDNSANMANVFFSISPFVAL
jgi:hypothetical protein